MKIVRQASLVLLAVLFVSGCKNFFDVPTGGGGGCTTNCTPISSGIFYVLNSNAGQVEIAGYSIVNGTLTPLTGSPYALASGPYAVAVAPNGSFLYVSTQSGIYRYTIGSGGALTLGSTTAISPDFAAYALQVDATDSWLVEASGSGYLYAIPINPADGTLSTTGKAQQVPLSGITPHQLTISPDNANIFVALGGSGTTIVPFSATSATPMSSSGAKVIAPKATGGAAVSVAVDPTNRLFYIGEIAATSGSSNSGGLRAFGYSSLSGTPAEVAGSPFGSGGLTPASILPTASGAYVYVANSTVSNSSTGSVAGFSVTATGTTYSLSALSGAAAATGTNPVHLAEDSTGSVLLLVNSGGGPDLDVYTFDTTTLGKLDPALAESTGTDPVGALSVAAAP